MEANWKNTIAFGKRKFYLLFFVIFPCGINALEWNVGVNVAADFTDNALRIAENDSAEPVSERQDRYGAGIEASHRGDRLNLQADYTLGYTVFSENSQTDRDTRSGRANLVLGRASDTFNLNLEHSVQLTVIEPGELELLENLDERSISLVQPIVNFRLSSVDTLRLIGNLQEINFDEEETRNSSRKGAIIQWIHFLNRGESFVIDVSQEDVEFEFFPAADYQLNYATITYSNTMRNLDYTLTVGKNRSVQEGQEDFDGGRYSAELNYRSGNSSFGFRASKNLTDSSQGMGNDTALSGEVEVDSGNFGEADQFESERQEIFWEADVLCGRCTLSANLNSTKETYLERTDQDNENLNASLRLAYNFNSRAGLTFQYLLSEREFLSLSDRDFDSTRKTLTYQHLLGVNLGMRLSVSQLIRDNTNIPAQGEIVENIYGLALNYDF